MKQILTILLLGLVTFSYGQFGIGLTASNDLYQYIQNPDDETGESTSAGSALLNVGVGPKIWVGGNDFSLSLEAQANLGLLGLSAKDYKGLGIVSFPIMAKMNFKGLSALDKEGRFGWSLGAGIQYSKTELFYLKDSFEEKGGSRAFEKTFVGQVGYGFGISGFSAHVFTRYGYNPDYDAHVFHLGIQYDFNFPKLAKISSPESEL